jgi:hypothetical protein
MPTEKGHDLDGVLSLRHVAVEELLEQLNRIGALDRGVSVVEINSEARCVRSKVVLR